MLVCMEICKELKYNFNVESVWHQDLLKMKYIKVKYTVDRRHHRKTKEPVYNDSEY